MKINRLWAMPNKVTFSIKPIAELLKRYVKDGIGWIDPFAGMMSPAEFRNDLNPNTNAEYHFHANTFIEMLSIYNLNGALFDPPYSLRQLKECYKGFGKELSFTDTKTFPTTAKDLLAPRIKQKGIVICCGWDSNGFGKSRGFELIEILLVCHGGRHNDTIVTVESKI